MVQERGRKRTAKAPIVTRLTYPDDSQCRRAEGEEQASAAAEQSRGETAQNYVETIRLNINEARAEDCNSKTLLEQREQARRFLVTLPWASEDTGDGITWLELFMLFRLHGWAEDDEVSSQIGTSKPIKDELKTFKAAVRWNATFGVDSSQ